MLRRLTVRRFKSLRDVTVDLPRLGILFGANASGKSNLLEAVQALAWVGNARTLLDALGDPAPIRGYASEAFSLHGTQLRADHGSFLLEADMEIGEERYRYRIEPRIDYKSGALTVSDEYLDKLSPSRAWRNPAIERMGGALHIRRKGKGAHPHQEPVGLRYALLSDRRFSGPGYEGLDAVREELAKWRVHALEPQVAMRVERPPAAVSDIGVRGEFLAPFLNRLQVERPEVYRNIARLLRAALPAVSDPKVELDAIHGVLRLSVRQHGAEISSRILSEGTLRALALCATAVNPWGASLLAIEEPESGLDPLYLDRIGRLIAGLAQDRQVLVTTHSPLFVDAVLREVKELPDPPQCDILHTKATDRGTTVRSLGPLFRSVESLEGLELPPEDTPFQSLLMRGLADA